jgi:hypothetical protein
VPLAGSEPLSADDFLRRADSKQAVAKAFVDDRRHCQEAWLAAGSAVEHTLKAVIMRRTGMNGWPDRASRPDLHTHDLKALLRIAGIDPTTCPPHMRGRLRVVLTWDHGHEYASGTMARRVARDMVVAACGDEGVCSWLLTQ